MVDSWWIGLDRKEDEPAKRQDFDTISLSDQLQKKPEYMLEPEISSSQNELSKDDNKEINIQDKNYHLSLRSIKNGWILRYQKADPVESSDLINKNSEIV